MKLLCNVPKLIFCLMLLGPLTLNAVEQSDSAKSLVISHFNEDVIRGKYGEASFTARYQNPTKLFVRVIIQETSVVTRLDLDSLVDQTRSFGMPLTETNKQELSGAAKAIKAQLSRQYSFSTEHGKHLSNLLFRYAKVPLFHHLK